jgi:hypothetical protein
MHGSRIACPGRIDVCLDDARIAEVDRLENRDRSAVLPSMPDEELSAVLLRRRHCR